MNDEDPHTGNAPSGRVERKTVDEETMPASPANAAEAAPGEEMANAPAPAEAEPEVETLKREKDELYNRFLRAVADLENYRRRVLREKEELRQFAVSSLVESLLPVLEHLGLAVASARQAEKPEDIATGVGMVLEQFKGALAAVGLEEINPGVGEDFDPHRHESLSHAPSETVPEEKIVQLIRGGFLLNGRVLRPASVVLSSGPPKGETKDENGPKK